MTLFSRDEQLVLVALIGALLVGGGLLFYREMRPGGAAGAGGPVQAPPEEFAEPPEDAAIFVHVCGAVVQPGVYQLGQGARVIEAVDAAGGFRGDAARDALNLAALLVDGERVYVPTVREISQFGGAPGSGGGKVNINYADASALERLPGIGPALAQRIVEYRRQHGRFTTIEELKQVPGIGEKKFEQLKPFVTVN